MTRFRLARLRPILAAALLLAAASPAMAALGAVRISQIYGGGGNAGATYRNDFIELRNNGATPVSLVGTSVQYASATGSTWSVTVLAGTIAPGGYYLVQQAVGTGGTQDLPTPDATGSIAMSATAGKVALVAGTTALVGPCPIVVPGAAIDFVGYGPTASCFEGVGPTPVLSNTTAALRAGAGGTDTDDNSADFSVGAPAPRNSGSPGGGGGGTTPQDVAIYTIQGSGSASPLVGALVRTPGVVTRVNNNGFFMQDLAGDGDPATSDGIFVFTGGTTYAPVAVGNLVAVTATVAEFNTGAASNVDTAAHPVTELTGVTAVTLTGTGYVIAPTPVTLPEASNDDLERYEGMLVRIDGPFTIQQNFFQGRYGQLTLAVGGRLETPTNRFRPGPQANALADENARRRIVLDDGSSLQNPSPTPYLGAGALPRAGDVVVGSLVGVVDYGLATSSNADFGDYRIHPTAMPSFAIANPRSAAPAPAGGNVKVASFNVLNYFTTFTDGNTASGQGGQGCSLGGAVSAANCRGADNLAEFGRQRAKIVEALAAVDADVVGLMEIQNNGSVAVQNLVDALNARIGAAAYAVLPLPAQGTGTDAIRVAMIYKPARLGLAGVPTSDPAAVNNRPPLAQTFALASGERFSVIVNHLKSKGSCPGIGDADAAGNVDSGDGQGCWNAQRLQQAQRLRTFVAQVQNAAGSDDVLLIGDFNAYAQEDPIFDLVSSGYVDQPGRFAAGAYSYVFNGSSGRLDHAITTASLSARVVSAAHWHINADETALADYNTEFKAPALCNATMLCPADPYAVSPYRSSDHDPVVVGLAIGAAKTCDVNGDGRVDLADLALIRGRSGQPASGPNDPFDVNRDGVVSVADVRYCQSRMTAAAP